MRAIGDDVPVSEPDAVPVSEPDAVPEECDLQDFLLKGFYDVLEVDQTVTKHMLTKAFKRLCLTHHPHKGGNPAKFLYLKFAYDVLRNTTTRDKYDRHGRAYFESNIPKPAEPRAAPIIEIYEVYIELINVGFAKSCQAEFLALRRLKRSSLVSFAQLLQYYIDRARNVKKGIGEITTIQRENKRAAKMGYRGRRTSGVLGMESIPVEVADENVPDAHKGRSPFGEGSLVKNCLRTGLGDAAKDLDQEDAHFHAMLELAAELGIDTPAVTDSVENREDWYQSIMIEARCTRKEAKIMRLAVGYMCGIDDSTPTLLKSLHSDVKMLYHALGARYPERVKLAEAWGKKRPLVTVGSIRSPSCVDFVIFFVQVRI